MKLYLFYSVENGFDAHGCDYTEETLVHSIVTNDVTKAVEIFCKNNYQNIFQFKNDIWQMRLNDGDLIKILEEDNFVIDSKYDIDKLTKLLDSLENCVNHYGWANSFGYCITHEDLTKLINECKKDFVSIVDKISFLKEKNLFIEGLTDEQINFYYEKFAEVK